MTNKPRIAFCFSGQARTLDKTYIFFQKNLFDVAKEQGFEYDVFCAVEDDEDGDKVTLLNPTKVEKIKSSEVEDKISFRIKDDKNFKYFDCEYTQFLPWAVQQQWYKMEQSIVIKDKYKAEKHLTYDIVFRLRFDVYFLNKIDFHNINSMVNKNGKIICNQVGKILNNLWSICDLYFICNDNNSTKLVNNLFNKYGYFTKNLISLRFLFVTVASKFILLLLKINYRRNVLSDKILLSLKHKYMFGLFVPEVTLYKSFVFNNIKVLKSTIKIGLLRKNGDLFINGTGNTKFEV